MSVGHRTYARALYPAAKDKGRVQQVREDLRDFAESIEAVAELRLLLRNPQLEPSAKAGALDAVLEGTDETLRNFVRLLAEKGRAGEIEEVAREFERLAAEEEGLLEVELTTAYKLSDDEAGAILRQIEVASGRRVEATRKVDPSLIGGIVLQAGSMRLDASVRGRFERLRRELAAAG